MKKIETFYQDKIKSINKKNESILKNINTSKLDKSNDDIDRTNVCKFLNF